MLKTILLVTTLAASSVAFGQITTAVCTDPVGTLFGQQGEQGNSQPVDAVQDMKGASITILIDPLAMGAQITTQVPDGGRPLTEMAIPVMMTDEQLSFLTAYQDSVWLYSLFRKAGMLLVSEHVAHLPAGSVRGAIGRSLKAKCEISVK